MIETVKYPSLCSHDYQKSLTNQVQLPCSRNGDLTHKITQFGKFCNKCTHIIKDSFDQAHDCIVCSSSIEDYIKDRELCQHSNHQYAQIMLKCLDDPKNTHNVVFNSQVCSECYEKIKASFLGHKQCQVCAGKEKDILKDIQKMFISPAFSHIQNVINLMRDAKCSEQVFKNQIQSACKAAPQVAKNKNDVIPQDLIDQYNREIRAQDHQSKRYRLYPQCKKHRQFSISVCNLCMVALLNIGCCPYGCLPQGKVQKQKKDNNVKTMETAFMHVFPQLDKTGYYFQLFKIRLTQQRGRLDRWQASLHKVQPKSSFQQKFVVDFPLYCSSVAISNRDYLVCGGVKGKHFTNMQTTNSSFVISLSSDAKQFQIHELSPMNHPRSGHSLVFHNQRKMVFAIGGFIKGKGFSKKAQVYSLQHKKWFQIAQLQIQRSKPTVLVFKGEIYVFGGLTQNYSIMECMGQKFNFETQNWEKIDYQSFTFPYLTNATASTSLIQFQEKQKLFLIGGSNTQEFSPLIKQLDIKKSSFDYNDKSYHMITAARAGCVLGLIGQDTLICFGGVMQQESILKIDALKLKLSKQDVDVLYVYDQIFLGSYRDVSREVPKSRYLRIKQNLEKLGLIKQQSISMEQNKFVTPTNCHMLQQMWFKLGKTYVWVPI